MSSHPSSSFPELRWVPVAQSLLLRLNLSSAGWPGGTRQGRETGGRRGRIRLYHGCTGRWGRITCHSLPGMPRMWTRVEAKETMVGGRHNSHCGGHICIVQGIMILSISRGIAPQLGSNQIQVAEIDARHDLSRWFQHVSMLMVTTS